MSVFGAVRGVAKKHKDQDALTDGWLEGEDAELTQRKQDGGEHVSPGCRIREWQTGPPALL